MTTLINATETPFCKALGTFVRALADSLARYTEQASILDTASVPLDEAPKTAADKRQHAIARLLYVYQDRNGDFNGDVSAFVELDAMRKMGRTERWQKALDTIRVAMERDNKMFVQYCIYANYAAM